jgi:predicted O-methyltransferase YrrM
MDNMPGTQTRLILSLRGGLDYKALQLLRAATGASVALVLPPLVARAEDLARRSAFSNSCAPAVGSLLRTLSAAVPKEGRILEVGTGAGIGLAWIVTGLRDRTDVEVLSIERNAARVNALWQERWPGYVSIVHGDAISLIGGIGNFDLIFADAPAIKGRKLRELVEILRVGGFLVLDDMDVSSSDCQETSSTPANVHDTLAHDSRVVYADIAFSSGVLLVTRAASGPLT